MEFLHDWRIWVVGISLVKDVVLVLGIILVKFNDLKHLAKDITDMKQSQTTIINKLENVEKNQSAMQAVCDERHSKK